MSSKNYYDILGLKKTATEAEIKSAYRKLAKKFHPDVSKEKNAEARFKEIGEAYETLRDVEKRAQYDEFQRSGGRGSFDPRGFSGAPGGVDPGNFGDMFEELLRGRGGPGAGAAGPRPRAGRDLTAELAVTLEDIYEGAAQTVELNIGSEMRSLKVKIPQGAEDGQQIRLRGQGHNGVHGGSPGDLYLKLKLRAHPTFTRDGRDIVCKLKLAPWEAALGGSFAVPTLGGAVKLKVAAGAQAGQRLRLKGRGLPGEPAGDQYAELQIVNPPLSDEMIEAMQALAAAAPFDPRGE
jgi:curved DNA-binding protein